jgi:ubiquinone/menaquinone biosynthesis C-methylase UbiE
MAHKFDPANMAKLDSPDRRRMLPVDDILKSLGLSEGEILVDIGAGIGYFSLPASAIVGPRGKVIALDTAEQMVVELERRVALSELGNVMIRRSAEYAFGLDDSCADIALMVTMLHEVEDMPKLLEETYRVVRDGGRIGIVEWLPTPMEHGPAVAERISRESMRTMLAAAGFIDINMGDINGRFYLTKARKRDQ